MSAEKNPTAKNSYKQQIRSILKGFLIGSVIILAVGILAYLLLFFIMLLI